MHRELPALIKPLESGVRRMLDIGCGHAYTSIELANWRGLDMLYLMDGQVGLRQNGYSEVPISPWFNTEVTRQNALARGIKFEIVAPDPSLTFDVDALISLLSWGHHYPVSVYVDLVKRSLKPGGTVIMDLRHGKGGLDEMVKHGFVPYEALYEGPKSERRFFRKGIHNGLR